jgi:hypothetical protein
MKPLKSLQYALAANEKTRKMQATNEVNIEHAEQKFQCQILLH